MGEKCHFAHGEAELRSSHEPLPMTNYNSGPMMGGGGPPQTGDRPVFSNYKTQKCMFYEQGNCKKGTSCSFAHGDTEMRRLV